MTAPSRFLIGAGTASLALALAAGPFVLTAPAYAKAKPTGGTSGTNAKGNLTVHDAATGLEVEANNPKVCTFTIVADGYVGGPKDISYWFQAWPGGSAHLDPGTIHVAASGTGQTGVLSLPNGMYKPYGAVVGNENGADNFKVFKVDCPDTGGTMGGTTGGTTTGTTGTTDGGTTGTTDGGTTGTTDGGTTGTTDGGTTGTTDGGTTGTTDGGTTGTTDGGTTGTTDGGTTGTTDGGTTGTTDGGTTGTTDGGTTGTTDGGTTGTTDGGTTGTTDGGTTGGTTGTTDGGTTGTTDGGTTGGETGGDTGGGSTTGGLGGGGVVVDDPAPTVTPVHHKPTLGGGTVTPAKVLPFTGRNTGTLALWGLSSLIAGIGLTSLGRKQGQPARHAR